MSRRASTIAVGALLTLFCLARGVLLAETFPVFHGPDEPAHFDYVQALAEGAPQLAAGAPCPGMSPETTALTIAFLNPIARRSEMKVPDIAALHLPDPASRHSRSSGGCASASSYPPLYYAAGSIAYQVSGLSLPRRIFAVRLVSVFLGAAASAAAFLAGYWFFGAASGGALLALTVIAQPQIWFVTSIVNNDAALLLASFTCLAAIASARAGSFSGRAQALMCLSFAAGCLSKPTLLFYGPVLFVATVVRAEARTLAAWLRTAALFLPGLVLAGAWQVTHPPLLSGPVHALGLKMFLTQYVLQPLRAETLWVLYYWMTWGWVDTVLRQPYYQALELVLAVAAIGLAAGWTLLPRDRRVLAVLGFGATAYGMVMLYAIEFKFMQRSSLAFVQGRYLLPVFPLTAGALLVGLEALSRRLGTVDLRWVLPLLLLVVDVASFASALSRYYGT